ncbi:MAG: asparagine synthase (glutamine-hydrolyzing) [Methylococcales bacterium]
MCGICGKLNFDRQEVVDQGLIRQMMDVIQHRGPDGSGEFLSGPVGLGHRRLSIIDLDTGAQPMSNEDGSVWVVYNGEIYNFQELRTDLQLKGHQFKSSSDTEVIVHLYEEYGDQCATRLRGMFAFALWDERKQHLLLARDRVGVKPLYFTNTGTAILFASEIKSLLVDPSVDRNVNPLAIDRFLTYYYLPGNETMLLGISKLDPGHYLSVQDGKVTVEQYWDLHFNVSSQQPSFETAVETLREMLLATVKDHMISDVPVGVLLSGGVDSTGILSYAVQQTDKPIHTFTMGFSGAGFQDERPYAKLAAQKFRTIHHEISMSATDFREFLPKYVWHMEEPVCEPPAIALYFVSQLARQSSVKVLLSGEGGDEAFGGYQTYRNLILLEKLKSIFGSTNGLLRSGFKMLGLAGWKQIGRYADLIDLTLEEYYLSRTATPYTPFNQGKSKLYSEGLSAFLNARISGSVTRKLFEQVKDQPLLNRMLYVDTKTWLPDDLLIKADKMTMASSVELRVPLLDHRVLEFAASLPPQYKVCGWKLKRILKAALAESVPKEILNRKKTGFPVPYDNWMRKEMKEFIFDTIMSTNSVAATFFCKKEVTNLLETHQLGKGCSKEVFSLLVFELWHRQFVSASLAV